MDRPKALAIWDHLHRFRSNLIVRPRHTQNKQSLLTGREVRDAQRRRPLCLKGSSSCVARYPPKAGNMGRDYVSCEPLLEGYLLLEGNMGTLQKVAT